MDQNTAQNNNVQFPYPDFSGTNPTQQVQDTSQKQGQVQVQATTTNDDQKIDELRKNLDALIATEKQVQQTPPPSVKQEEEKKGQVGEDSNTEISSQQPDMPASHTQKPQPLPGMEKKLPKENLAEVSTVIPVGVGEGFDPLPSNLPKFNETLDNIMPDTKKPKPPQKRIVTETADSSQPTNLQSNRNTLKPEIQEDPSLGAKKQKDDFKITEETLDTKGELSIQKLLSEAINRNASDLHLSVGYPPILRIDGELVALDENIIGPEEAENLIFSILTDEKKELLEVNREIDLAYTYEGGVNARFRINAFYTMKNLSAAFRLIPSRVKTIEELMLPQMYNQFAKLKQGLVLVTGPTGHGKSTTIAAILEAINRTRFCHILTIEDPIEYVFEGKKALIDQREMNDDTHSWNIALRSALRQDPDVILVGEMRDFETIASAITLAETGHLVFATLHTNSASQTLDRIIDVFPENQQQQVRTQIANTLEAVVAQRLIPLDQGGRRAVSEIMLNNSAVSNLIREGKMHQVDNVIRTSSDIGMKYLERSLIDLVREGVISVQKAQEYAVHPEEVLRLLKS